MRQKHNINPPYVDIVARLNQQLFYPPISNVIKHDFGTLALVIPLEGPVYFTLGTGPIAEIGDHHLEVEVHAAQPHEIDDIAAALQEDVAEIAYDAARQFCMDIGWDPAYTDRQAITAIKDAMARTIWERVGCCLPGIIFQATMKARTDTYRVQQVFPRALFESVEPSWSHLFLPRTTATAAHRMPNGPTETHR